MATIPGIAVNPSLKKTYRTQAAFKKAFQKYTRSGELVNWYATDYGWVINLKRIVKSNSRKRNATGGPLDTHAARELELFTENDAQLYRSQEQPIQKNLILKMAKGVYNHAKAVKLYGYLMESGAKKYAREHSTSVSDWHHIFSPATRKAAAERFAHAFEVEAKLGNYDSYLPEKYKGWRIGKNPTKVKIKIGKRVVNGVARRKNGKVQVFVTPGVARKVNAVRQTSCKFCGLDIENFSPYKKCEWRDRGGNTKCDSPHQNRCHVPRWK
jgi:hypothetical protein